MTAIDPTIEAARGFIDGSLTAMRSAIAGSSADALNRRPAGDDTNPVAVLVGPRREQHAMVAERVAGPAPSRA